MERSHRFSQVAKAGGFSLHAGRVVFRSAGDNNGDGSDDFWMIYPNGERQLLLIFP